MPKMNVCLCVGAMLVFSSTLVIAQEAVDPAMMQRVEADYRAMKDMTMEEREAYRQQNRAAMTREEQRAYQQAFKALRPNLPTMLGADEYNVNPASTTRTSTTRVPGTNITYDSGVVTRTAGSPSQMVGNLFNTAMFMNTMGVIVTENVETTGSVTQITFDMQQTFFGSAVWSLYSNIMGTANTQVTSMGRGVMTGLNILAIMSPTTANAYSNGPFAAGIWQFDPSMTALGLDPGSINGQGFHGISQNDGAMGSMFTTITTGGMGLNAFFRVSGDVLQDTVPVELMHFTIDD